MRQGNNQERTLTRLSTDVTELGGGRSAGQARQEIHDVLSSPVSRARPPHATSAHLSSLLTVLASLVVVEVGTVVVVVMLYCLVLPVVRSPVCTFLQPVYLPS